MQNYSNNWNHDPKPQLDEININQKQQYKEETQI